MGRNASLAAQRSTITHVAAMCDRPDFQTLLPQVVLVGANQVGEERLARIRMSAPACVRIWRYTKAWMNSAVMERYMRLLGRCLKDYRQTYRFILYVDVLKAHICPAVLRAASAADAGDDASLWVPESDSCETQGIQNHNPDTLISAC